MTQPSDEVLESIALTALSPGPRLLVLGAVHGNETCGPIGIGRALDDLRAGRLRLRRGAVTFVPVANPKAYRQRSREGDRNLNRDLRERTHRECFEDAVGNRLCALLRSHDVLLDIHSFTEPGEPFVFAGHDGPDLATSPEWQFATRLGPAIVMHGWLHGFGRFLAERTRLGFPALSPSEGIGTTEFMRFAGGYGVTIECGRHDDPASADVAHRAIRAALAILGMTDDPVPAPTARTAIRITDSVVAAAEGDRVADGLAQGVPLAAGAAVALRADGETVAMPADGFVVFPNPRATPGQQLCYLAVASETPLPSEAAR